MPERAEDIDLIANWMAGGDDQLLEQVKHLTTSVTLNSPSVRAALAGFREIAAANPGRSLRFRFASNGAPSKERPALFPGRLPGIASWEAARLSPEPLSSAFVAALRETFREAPKPADLADATWTALITFMATSTLPQLEAFVRSVEFSTGLEEQVATKDTSIGLLVTEGHVTSRAEAEDAYLALFHHVTQLLCGPPPRRLLRADIATAIATATPSARISAALNLVTNELVGHAARLARLESSILLTDTTASEIATTPPPPAHLTHRAAVVSAIGTQLRPGHLVAVTGQPGTGKTQVLRLVADSVSASVAWVRLRDLNPNEALAYLASAMAVFKQGPPPELVVLDDMPVLHQAERLRERVQTLLRDPRWRHSRFISSSVGTHGNAAVSALGSLITVFAMPPLTAQEVEDLARQMGGTLDAHSSAFLVQMTGGHPQMLVAVCEYLARTGWELTGPVIRGLLERRFTDGLTLETAQRFIATVSDEGTRELVQRLRLCITRLRASQVHAVSGIDPPITDPITRVVMLDGVWLQRERENEWAMAPLIQCLPADALPADRRVACHRALALSYVGDNRTIDVANVRYVLHHMREGKLPKEFARLYREVATEALVRDRTPLIDFALRILDTEALPPGIGGPERLTLIALKGAVSVELGTAIAPATLDELTTSTDLTDDAKQIIAVTLGFRLNDMAAVSLVGNGIRALAGASHPELVRSRPTLVFGLFGKLKTAKGFGAWLDLLNDLTDDERREIEKERLWLASLIGTYAQVTENGHVQTRLDLARRARVIADAHRMFGLLAFAQRAEAVVLSETDAPAAIALLRQARTALPERSRERAVISAALVQLHHRQGDTAATVDCARELAASDTTGIEYQATQGALRGAIAAASAPVGAAALAEYAVDLARSSELVPLGSRIRALGELGVARWLAGDLLGSMRALVMCADELLAAGPAHEEWKQLIPISVHVINYIAATASGVTLSSTADKSAYAPPELGFFFKADTGYEASYNADKPLMLAALTVPMASQVENGEALTRAGAFLGEHLGSGTPHGRLAVAINAGAYLAVRGLLRELIISAWVSVANQPDRLPALPASWDRRDQAVVLFAVPQATLGVCLGFLDSAADGRARLADAIAAFRELDALGSNADWSRFADLLADSISRDASINDVMQRRARLGDGIQECSVMLLAALHPRASLTYAVRNHVAAIQTIWEILRRTSNSVSLLVEPYLRRFWQQALDEQAFRFRRPATIRAEFEAAAGLADAGTRIYTYLRVVLDGLGVDEQLNRTVFIPPLQVP